MSEKTAEVQHEESGHARDVHARNFQVWHSWWTRISTELCVCQTYKFYRSWWVFALYPFAIMKCVDAKMLTVSMLAFDLSVHTLTVFITEILQGIQRRTKGGRDKHQGFHVRKWPNIMFGTFILPMLFTLDPTVVIFPRISFLVFPTSTFHFLHAIYSMFHSMFPHQTSVCSSLLPHTHYMPHPSHPPCVNQHVNIRWTVWTVKLLFMQFSQGCCSSFLYACPLMWGTTFLSCL